MSSRLIQDGDTSNSGAAMQENKGTWVANAAVIIKERKQPVNPCHKEIGKIISLKKQSRREETPGSSGAGGYLRDNTP